MNETLAHGDEHTGLLDSARKVSDESYTNMVGESAEATSGMSKIPSAALFILIVEFCERLCFYGASLVFMTYMTAMLKFTNPTANAVSNAFSFWAYFTALIGGYVADAHWGKFKTIFWFGVVYLLGMCMLTVGALPLTFDSFPESPGTFTMVAYLCSLFFIGLGTGGIKANVSTMIADQLGNCSPQDTERVFRWFYWSINAGALVGQSVSPSLQNFGPRIVVEGDSMGSTFYLSFMVPTVAFLVGITVFVFGKYTYTIRPPTESILSRATAALRSAWSNKDPVAAEEGFFYRADPSRFSRQFIADLTQALNACKVFLLFPFYWLLYNQMQTNFITQGMWMDRPTWLAASQLNLVDSLIIVFLIPVFDSFVFPLLRKTFRTEFGAISRMAIGFVIAALAFVYAGLLQHAITGRGDWINLGGGEYEYLLHEGASKVSVWLQIPPYVLVAISEIFTSISALEFAYSEAPKSMKSIVMSLFLLTNAGGSLLGMALAPLFTANNFEMIFFGFSVGMVFFAMLFWKLFRNAYN